MNRFTLLFLIAYISSVPVKGFGRGDRERAGEHSWESVRGLYPLSVQFFVFLISRDKAVFLPFSHNPVYVVT